MQTQSLEMKRKSYSITQLPVKSKILGDFNHMCCLQESSVTIQNNITKAIEML